MKSWWLRYTYKRYRTAVQLLVLSKLSSSSTKADSQLSRSFQVVVFFRLVLIGVEGWQEGGNKKSEIEMDRDGNDRHSTTVNVLITPQSKNSESGLSLVNRHLERKSDFANVRWHLTLCVAMIYNKMVGGCQRATCNWRRLGRKLGPHNGGGTLK